MIQRDNMRCVRLKENKDHLSSTVAPIDIATDNKSSAVHATRNFNTCRMHAKCCFQDTHRAACACQRSMHIHDSHTGAAATAPIQMASDQGGEATSDATSWKDF